MILEIVQYGHPALRAKGRRIEVVDESLRRLAEDMLETMEAANGVGLAAQQVGVPVQMCVIDITGVRDRPSVMWVGGKEVDPESRMPLILLNPEVRLSGREKAGTEGCLSFPGMSGDVTRPEKVEVKAMDLEGRPVEFEASGLLARAVQHENDHLQGVLFIDRMSRSERKRLAEEIDAFLAEAGAGLGMPPKA